jgi:hypothetical protein
VKVRLQHEMSGLRSGSPWPGFGEVLEVDDIEGAQLCSLGIAVPVVEDRTEKAVMPPAEMRGEPGPEIADVGEGAVVKRGPGRPRKNP